MPAQMNYISYILRKPIGWSRYTSGDKDDLVLDADNVALRLERGSEKPEGGLVQRRPNAGAHLARMAHRVGREAAQAHQVTEFHGCGGNCDEYRSVSRRKMR